MSFAIPAFGLDLDLLWQWTVNVLASIGPLLSLFIGMGLFFTFLLWVKAFLERVRGGNKEDAWW